MNPVPQEVQQVQDGHGVAEIDYEAGQPRPAPPGGALHVACTLTGNETAGTSCRIMPET
jgi:hypothetical protein